MRLSLPKVKQNFGKRTLLFTGAEIFIKLPLNIVKSENIQTFCCQARHYFCLNFDILSNILGLNCVLAL